MFADIAAALAWLTVVPIGAHDGSRPVRWFPLVGWLFGGVALAIAFAGTIIGVGRLGEFVIGLGNRGGRGAHEPVPSLDGLGDTADAVWGAHDAAHRLDIMRDSRTAPSGRWR